MLFDSINFAIFLPLVFIAYWFIANKSLKKQNVLLLISSYFFYACWNWRFLFLLFASTLLDYYTGIKIEKSTILIERKRWFWLSIIANVGILSILKYYNFFINSFTDILSIFEIHPNLFTLKIIVPIGISFYTFHGLSYIIDIYNNKIKSEKSFINYSLFVSFFPLLVAGPIERATHLLPQIQIKRSFNYALAVDGLRQILWGLFKKLVIANHCAIYVDQIFKDYEIYSGSTLLLGAILFLLEVYTDFSAYSDIALGTAKLFSIELLQNFSFPLFSRNLTEFWRRWHISLSSWFRDYVYIPLGGSKNGKLITIRNTFVIFLLGGFWHGANWTFLCWGFVNALYLTPSIVFNLNHLKTEIVAKGKILPTILESILMLKTFLLMALVCIFFRSENISQAFHYFSKTFTKSLFSMPTINIGPLLYLLLFFLCIEWQGREHSHALKYFAYKMPKWLRLTFYCFLILCIFLSKVPEQKFIYFQF